MLWCAASAGAHGLVLCDWFVAACWLVCCCCSKWECIHCAFMLSSFVCVMLRVSVHIVIVARMIVAKKLVQDRVKLMKEHKA